MKISRFIVFLSLCALLFGSTLHAGSLSRAITKVAPAMIVGGEEPSEITVAATSPTTATTARADRIVTSTVTTSPASSSSSRRQAGGPPEVVSQTGDIAPTTTKAEAAPTASSPRMSSIPEDLAHKPATAAAPKLAPASGRIIHPSYPPKTSSAAAKADIEAKADGEAKTDGVAKTDVESSSPLATKLPRIPTRPPAKRRPPNPPRSRRSRK